MKTIHIINGPNLNMLGTREPEIYGSLTVAQINKNLEEEFHGLCYLEFHQTNHEGAIIDLIQHLATNAQAHGIVLNAGAYTHTSLAIADCIKSVALPVVEVHLSNVAAREAIRHTSLIAPVCQGTIAGFGAKSYSLAVRALL